MIKADFEGNKVLSINKSNGQHNEIATKFKLAQKSGALHANSLNLDYIIPEVSPSITASDIFSYQSHQVRLEL